MTTIIRGQTHLTKITVNKSNPLSIVDNSSKTVIEIKSHESPVTILHSGQRGIPGLSAYHSWLKYNPGGTEEQFLMSLKSMTLRSKTLELTGSEINNKAITLDHVPTDPLLVSMIIRSAPPQINGVDFYVRSNKVKWDSLSLESILEIGDYVTITY